MKKYLITAIAAQIILCTSLFAESYLIKGRLKEGCNLEHISKEYSIESLRGKELVIYTEAVNHKYSRRAVIYLGFLPDFYGVFGVSKSIEIIISGLREIRYHRLFSDE